MTTAQMKAIDADVLDALRQISWKDTIALITRPLERKLYVRVNKVMEALGGKWHRGKGGHVFGEPGPERIADAVATGTYDAFDAKQHFQFFETPRELVKRMLDLVMTNCGIRILEPSAGKGAIAHAAANRGARVTAIELNPENEAALRAGPDGLLARIDICDFLECRPDEITLKPYDAVVMNPPFTRSQDIAHVRYAYEEWLAPGGHLVAVMAPGFTFRQDRKATEFREWLDGLEHTIEKLPPGTFKEAGTMVSTVLVHITRGF